MVGAMVGIFTHVASPDLVISARTICAGLRSEKRSAS